MKGGPSEIYQDEAVLLSAISYPGTPFYSNDHANPSETTISSSTGIRSSSRPNPSRFDDIDIVVSYFVWGSLFHPEFNKLHVLACILRHRRGRQRTPFTFSKCQPQTHLGCFAQLHEHTWPCSLRLYSSIERDSLSRTQRNVRFHRWT